ncbi:MAG: hypothetical protein NT003_04060 [Candidatus Magasanikbacteria bacterium]|nr:hypothetical protein [Candidatus Magasanikbacteria bacterium]
MNIFSLHFTTFITHLGPLAYPLIGFVIFFEGEAVIFTVMFLSYHKTLNILFTLPIIILAVIATDVTSYMIGRHGKKYFPRVAQFYTHLVHPIDNRLKAMTFGIFLISKFTYGLHRAIIIRVGQLDLPFWKFFRINLLTTAVWITTISGLAYGSWRSVRHFENSFKYIGIVLAGSVLALLIGSHVAARISKSKLKIEDEIK